MLGMLKHNVHINIMRYGKIFFIFSIFLIVVSVVVLFTKGLNLGIDFKGGIVMDFKSNAQNLVELSTNLSKLTTTDFSIKEFKDNSIQIIVPLSESVNPNGIITSIKNAMPLGYEHLQTQFVGPSVSRELITSSLIAIMGSLLGIFMYLWYRFDWQYGIIGIITLIHDVLVSLLFVSLFDFEFNLTSVAALLTIIGYSINDTVVIFDQVRENIKKHFKQDNNEILNISLSQVLSRSLGTSITVILVVLSIFLFGGMVLKSFSFILLIGLFFGTYSSICIALPLLKYIGNMKEIVTRKKE